MPIDVTTLRLEKGDVTTSMRESSGLIVEHSPHRLLTTAAEVNKDLNEPYLYSVRRPTGKVAESLVERRSSGSSQPAFRVAELIGTWLADESGHDERFWPIFEKDLNEAK